MTLSELMAILNERAVRLQRDGSDLVVLGEEETLSPSLLNGLSAYKDELLSLVDRTNGDWLSPGLTITPEMLPLVELSAADIERVVSNVPGGAANVQDVYPLAPLQEGILFHHLMAPEGDPYLLHGLYAFDSRGRLDRFLQALQAVIDRHDILRTAVQWEGLPEPAQVVWRQAPLNVEEVSLDPGAGAIAGQLLERFNPRRYRIDITRAPLIRVKIARDAANARWVMMLLNHHLLGDHTTLDVIEREIHAHLLGQAEQLPEPLPFRNFVAQARLGVSREEHEAFFRQMLGDVDEPTLPFGLADVHGDGSEIVEARREVDASLAKRLRERARVLGVSAASLCHLAWARVLARVSGREDVVFGTVLFGRMQGGKGADRAPGMFVNTLPVRIRVGEEGAQDSVRRTHKLLTQLLRHEHASLVLAQRCSGVAAPAPLFSALLNYRYDAGAAEVRAEARQGWEGIEFLGGEERTNYPVSLNVDDLGEGFSLNAQTQEPIDPDRICAYMRAALEQLIEALERAPLTAMRNLDALPASERRQMLVEWNATRSEYPHDQLIHELFERQAARAPETVAVADTNRRLTYGALNAEANRLARHLRGLGLRPEARVAVLLDRSLELVIAELAILKCGAAYAPLDQNAPTRRQAFMIEDCQANLVLTVKEMEPPHVAGAPRVNVDELRLEGQSADNLGIELNSEVAAYIMYTSGSSGEPKGVVVPHRAIGRLVFNNGYAEFEADDRVAFVGNPAFDVTTMEVWAPLLRGGCLVVIPQEVMLEPKALACLLSEEQVSILHLVAGLLSAYAEPLGPVFERLRYLLTGGDVVDPRAVARVLRHSPPRRLIHCYGPSESTTFATTDEVREVAEGATSLSIGRPIGNTQVYVLDGHGAPTPVGVTGELYIGGDGVARGYLNRPDLTAERFVINPFTNRSGARMYKTGDLGRYLPDGKIEFLGRNDSQVKIRGMRVELGEIEARLAEHACVREVVVVAREDRDGDKRLVAYYTMGPNASSRETTEAMARALRERVSAALPEYMAPAAYVMLEELPLTANGKLDRKALPEPEGEAYAARGYEAPVGEIETMLASIWAEALKLERVGRHDNFFELGGHSLLAVSLIERMRRAGLHADVRALFTTATVAALAAGVGGGGGVVEVPPNRIPHGCRAITPEMLPLMELSAADIERIVGNVPGGAANVQDIYPLAPLQEGILFHHLMAPEGDPYLLHGLHAFDSRDRLDRFLQALQAVIDRHDILRTAVQWEGLPEPAQVVWRQAPLNVEEVSLDPGAGAVAGQLLERFNPRHYRIDITQAPLIRVKVARDAANARWVMMLLNHHLLGDHTTLDVIEREIHAHLLGQAEQLPEPLPFRNFVAQARLGVSREEHEAFFRQMLGDVDEPTLPFGLANVHGDGSAVKEARREVDATVARRLRERARGLGVSAASLCHLAWARALARVSGREDVVFGTVLFGRMQGSEGADRAPGIFMNTLPVRIRVGEEGAQDSVRRTHELLTQLLRHEHASLVLAQRLSGIAAPAPLFSALLNYRHSAVAAEVGAEAQQAWEGIEFLGAEERTNYPFMMSVDDLGEGFSLNAQTQEPIDPDRVCAYMQTALEQLVEALEQAPTTAMRRLDALPVSERRQVLVEWNATRAEYPQDQRIHELFEAQAAKHPEATAVANENDQLSYGELNVRANRLAHHLRRLGARPDARVALCVERSLEMVVGLLAILKAGGAYVPLDPAYPIDRLTYMLEDSAAIAALTHAQVDGEIRSLLAGTGVPVIDLEADAGRWESEPDMNPDRASVGLSSEHLAYVIYTSGSTGKPKGSMIPHRGICNRLFWMQRRYDLTGQGAVLQKTPFSFDVSVWEFFWPLMSGARLVMAKPGGHQDRDYLIEEVERRQITAIHFVPSMLQVFLEGEGLDRLLSLNESSAAVRPCRTNLKRDSSNGSTWIYTISMGRRKRPWR